MAYIKSVLPVVLFGCLVGCVSSTSSDTTTFNAEADKQPLSEKELAEVAQLEVVGEKAEPQDTKLEQTAEVVVEEIKSQQPEAADKSAMDKAIPEPEPVNEHIEAVLTEPVPAPSMVNGANGVNGPEDTLPEVKNIEVGENQRLFGSEEWVYLPGVNRNFSASIRSDVDISLIKAETISVFERNGKEWIRFTIDNESEMNLPITVWLDKRPVVTTWIQVGDYRDRTSFVLINEIPSKHHVLLGKNFLRDTVVIDPDKKYLQPKRQ